jgi:hypothetical protein
MTEVLTMRSPLLILSFSIACASQVALAAEPAPPEIERFLRKQGPVVDRALLRSEGGSDNQIVVNFCIDENLKGGKSAGAGNPANAHCEMALFFNRKGKWVFANQVSLGQGGILAFKDGVVKAEAVTYGPKDAPCCPSNRTAMVFSTAKGKLTRSRG